MPRPRPSWFRDSMTLAEAKRILMRKREDGITCPCCGQYAKVYRRSLSATATRTVIALSKHYGYQHLQSLLKSDRRYRDLVGRGEATGGHFWGLIEQQPGQREDGASNNGWWRVTEHGREWLRGAVLVPSHALIYNGECLGLTGDLISVETALGEKFDFRELMS